MYGVAVRWLRGSATSGNLYKLFCSSRLRRSAPATLIPATETSLANLESRAVRQLESRIPDAAVHHLGRGKFKSWLSKELAGIFVNAFKVFSSPSPVTAACTIWRRKCIARAATANQQHSRLS